MKKIEAIIRPFKLEDVKIALVFITSIDSVVRIRTGDKDEEAL